MLRRWFGVVAVVLFAAGSIQLSVPVRAGAVPTLLAACPARNIAVTYPYPISGFWIFQRRDPCEIRSILEAIHQQGGDTVLTFGPRLTQRNISTDGQILDSSGRPDPVFADCVLEGQSCYRDAVAAVEAVHPDNQIVTTYAYSSLERYGAALLRCSLDRELLETADRIFYRLLVPDSSPGSCAGSSTRSYRLVLVAGAPADWLATLLSEADAYGVSVYPGLPTSPTRAAPEAWRPDLAHLAILNEFTRRVLTDYAGRHGGHESLHGLYQSFETPLRQTTHADFVTLYESQHALVRQFLPGRQIVISPYWDARRGNINGTRAADIKTGFKNVARTDVDVISPQDGRGTGKVGLFWPYEVNRPVDSRLAVPSTGISPGTTYGNAYFGSTTDFYKAAADARQELADQGVNIELWATLEAFEPTGNDTCGQSYTLTDKARLDHALTFARTYPSKIISYMWDGYYTCGPPGELALNDQITADFDQPVVTHAFKWRSSHSTGGPLQDGITIRGYQLTNSTIHLTWYDSSWLLRSQDLIVNEVGWFDPDTGMNSPQLPDRMQSLWVPFSWANMAPAFWIHITITNGSGRQTTHRYSLGY